MTTIVRGHCRGRGAEFDLTREVIDPVTRARSNRDATVAEIRAALALCAACPLLNTCRDEEPAQDSVHAGRIVDSRGTIHPNAPAFRARRRNGKKICANLFCETVLVFAGPRDSKGRRFCSTMCGAIYRGEVKVAAAPAMAAAS